MKLGQEEDKRGGRALFGEGGGWRVGQRASERARGADGGRVDREGEGGSEPARRMRVDVSAVPLGCGE